MQQFPSWNGTVSVCINLRGENTFLQIPVSSDIPVASAIKSVMNAHHVPDKMLPLVKSTVEDVIAESAMREFRNVVLEELKKMTLDQIEQNVETLATAYKAHTVRYTDKVEPVFPKAYNALVTSTIPNIFDTLLQLERTYSQAIEEAWDRRERDLEEMQERHAQEMAIAADAGPNVSMARLSEQHLEEMELFQATRESELQDLYATQKREYRDFVVKVHDEMLIRAGLPPTNGEPERISSRSPSVMELVSSSGTPDGGINGSSGNGSKRVVEHLPGEGRHVVSAAIKKLEKMPSSEVLSMDSVKERRKREESVKKVQEEVVDPQTLKMIKEIEEMGFTSEQAKGALELSGNNLEQAVFLLLENIDRVNEHNQTKSPVKPSHERERTLSPSPSNNNLRKAKSSSALGWNASPRYPSSHPLNANSTSSQQQNFTSSGSSTPSGFLTPSESSPSLSRRGFSPLAFLQQQQGKLSVQGAAQSFRKVSNLLGKAILGLDEANSGNQNEIDENDLSESFTTYFGTQVRVMYNLRLSVSQLGNVLFQPPADLAQELAFRAQTASTLYSNNLSGVLLLLRPKDFAKYSAGKSANR
ncbi:hypothetical protein HDU76_009447, partial [Blyttiomyces sp. JEL0837]